jgi:hypothetical protein
MAVSLVHICDNPPTTRCSVTHPRESAEWHSMSMHERYTFFAPIWRVMRDDNMSVDEVARQVTHVALAVKAGTQVCAGADSEIAQVPPSSLLVAFVDTHCVVQGDALSVFISDHSHVAVNACHTMQPSDMRHHKFRGRLHGARVVYFRASISGACDYVNDQRYLFLCIVVPSGLLCAHNCAAIYLRP